MQCGARIPYEGSRALTALGRVIVRGASMTLRFVVATLLAGCAWAGTHAEEIVLDDFRNLQTWKAVASDGATLEISQGEGHNDPAGMQLDFNLSRGGGWVIARRDLPLELPENFSFSFFLRGDARANHLEFKLVDTDGKSVWRRVLRNLPPTKGWQRVRVRKVELEFAWGPAGGDVPRAIGALEIAVSAGKGGKGTLLLDDMRLEPRDPSDPASVVPVASASSALPGQPAEALVGGAAPAGWHSAAGVDSAWLRLDFGKVVDVGGITIDWHREDFASAYRVLLSDDGVDFETAYETRDATGRRSYVPLPGAQSRYLRIELERSNSGNGFGIRAVRIEPYRFTESPESMFSAIARDSIRGLYPRYLLGEQTYWTVVGTADDEREGLLNEDGMLEVAKGDFSVEPFLYCDGDLITWGTGSSAQSLEQGYLPIPSVIWRHGDLELTSTAYAMGEPHGTTLYARYRVSNHGAARRQARLYLAVRPFQVNPPWQSLNMVGGTARIARLVRDDRVVHVNHRRTLESLTEPEGFGASTFEQGSITEYLQRGELPARERVIDPIGYASGAFSYDIDLAPGESREVYLAMPPAAQEDRDGELRTSTRDEESARRAFSAAVKTWQGLLSRVDIQVPPVAQKLIDSMRSNIAYIFINRDGPAIQPGSRDYARSWIRDGALTSLALLEMGYPDAVRDFLRWYAEFQMPDGRIPCCVDARGPDPVEEHDSTGQFIFALMSYYRYTNDVDFLREMWPRVMSAVIYIEGLRARRMTTEYRTTDKLAYFGLAPESISHEGYSSHPVHSYWDNFFLLRGLKDATQIAATLEQSDHADRYAHLRDAFRTDLYESIQRSMAMHSIDFIPGSVELGDFDPTSTSIAVSPGGELSNLPEPELSYTYDRYFEFFRRRRDGTLSWETYTPYEVRNVGTLVRLGREALAAEALEFFLDDQRPRAWNAWAEVVWRNPRAPGFIGDMPHTWVGSGFIRSVRSLFVYEQEEAQRLVLAAGVPRQWITAPEGITVNALPTPYGPLSYRLQRDGDDAERVTVESGMRVPPGGIAIRSPSDRPLREVIVNGSPADGFAANEVVVHALPAEILLRY